MENICMERSTYRHIKSVLFDFSPQVMVQWKECPHILATMTGHESSWPLNPTTNHRLLLPPQGHEGYRKNVQ